MTIYIYFKHVVYLHKLLNKPKYIAGEKGYSPDIKQIYILYTNKKPSSIILPTKEGFPLIELQIKIYACRV